MPEVWRQVGAGWGPWPGVPPLEDPEDCLVVRLRAFRQEALHRPLVRPLLAEAGRTTDPAPHVRPLKGRGGIPRDLVPQLQQGTGSSQGEAFRHESAVPPSNWKSGGLHAVQVPGNS